MRPVLVAGAGPVGLSVALGLARRGVPVHVLEAEPELSREARASTFHPPTLEMFAAWGVADAVLPLGRRVDRLQYWERASRTCVATFDYRLLAGETPYPFRFQCPQDQVTRVLLPALLATGRARVDFGHAVTGLADRGTHVEVAATGPGGPVALEGSWLVGADGARSTVRRAVGVPFPGMTYVDRFLLCATDLDLEAVFPGLGPVAYVFDPDEWVILMRQPRLLRVIFRLRDEEDEAHARREPAVRARIARFAGDGHAYALASTSVYSVHQRVAVRFRVGRVLLAGDAAHVNNPTGGLGMNSGIHDAWVLADRLARVLDGGGQRLLDAYAGERRRAAVEAVQRDSDASFRALGAADPSARAARNRALAEAAADPERARAFLRRASMIATAPRPEARA